jgi:hypothetical protein
MTEPRSSGHLSVLAGPDSYARCHSYASAPPILDIAAGAVDVSVSPIGRTTITCKDVAFAAELARAARQYADRCAQLHAERVPHADDAGACSCATQPA